MLVALPAPAHGVQRGQAEMALDFAAVAGGWPAHRTWLRLHRNTTAISPKLLAGGRSGGRPRRGSGAAQGNSRTSPGRSRAASSWPEAIGDQALSHPAPTLIA